jgi:hypothetical protein
VSHAIAHHRRHDDKGLAMVGFGISRKARAAVCAVAVVLAAATALAATPGPCPAVPGQRLVYIDIFDGPPEGLADLVPDQHSSPAAGRAWNVWRLEAGPQGLFVKCGYGKALAGPYSRMETVRLPGTVKSCRADFKTGRAAADLTLVRFSCQ